MNESTVCKCGHEAFWHVRIDRPADCLADGCDCEQFDGGEDE